MALSINTNLMALMASNNLTQSYGALSKSIDRLSSGLRINGAADDAAGLAVRELMRADIALLYQGVRNANDGISLLQTMDGAAQVIDEKLIRMKELASQAATGTYSDQQRMMMDMEFQAMKEEIDRIAKSTDFLGISMLDAGSGGTAAIAQLLDVGEDANAFADTNAFVSAFATYGSGQSLIISYNDGGRVGTSAMTITDSTSIAAVVAFINSELGSATASWSPHNGLAITDDTPGVSETTMQFMGGGSYSFGVTTAGADATDGQVKIHFGTGNNIEQDYYYLQNQNMTTSSAGLDILGLTLANMNSAAAAFDDIHNAIIAKDTGRAHFGSMINRLQNTVINLSTQAENLTAAESQISDIDVAFETTEFMNNQIKAQAAIAMLAQANMMPQMALKLLG